MLLLELKQNIFFIIKYSFIIFSVSLFCIIISSLYDIEKELSKNKLFCFFLKPNQADNLIVSSISFIKFITDIKHFLFIDKIIINELSNKSDTAEEKNIKESLRGYFAIISNVYSNL